MVKKLYRSRDDKVIAGVCGGIAEHFDVDPIWVRLSAVLIALANGIGIVLYILAWILVPQNPNQKSSRKTVAEEAAEKLVKKASTKKVSKVEVPKKEKGNSSFIFGGILVFFGAAIIMKNVFAWFNFSYIWPVLLIVFGVYLIARKSK